MLNLSKPYPFLYYTKRNVYIAVIIGIVIFGINCFINDAESVKEHLSIGGIELCFLFGAITCFAIMLLLEVIPRFFFSEELRETWTIQKEICFISALLLTIISLNYLSLFLVVKVPENFLSITQFFWIALNGILIGALPTACMIWVNYTVILKRNLKEVKQSNTQLKKLLERQQAKTEGEKIVLPSNNSKENIHLDLSTLWFIRSEGNYVETYSKENNKINKKIYRASIQMLQKNLSKYPSIIRTHRSYLVNIHKIKYTKGNARNFQLYFDETDLMVPVSRSKFQEINKILAANSQQN